MSDTGLEHHKRAMDLCEQADRIRKQADDFDRLARELMKQAYKHEIEAHKLCKPGTTKDILWNSAMNIRLEWQAIRGRGGIDPEDSLNERKSNFEALQEEWSSSEQQ